MGGHDRARETDQRDGRALRKRVHRHWTTGPAWAGAALALAAGALALWIWRAVEQSIPGAAGASWWILAGDLLLALGFAVVALVVWTVLAALTRRRLPVPFLAVLVGSVLLLGTMGAGPSTVGWFAVCAVVLAAAPMVGAWLGGLVGTGPDRDPRRSGPRPAGAVVALLALTVLAGWLAWPGPGAPDRTAARTGHALADPTAPGEHRVRVTTYGGAATGSSDRYGPAADVVTDPVDATDVVEGWASGSQRAEVWGFDSTALPLNATVWAPAGEGPYPLVLVVHGNSPHGDSELGFDYLGELLASRGYVVASLDQSFLNTSLLDRSGGVRGADRARAWLLLQHLELWSSWAQDGAGPAPADPSRVAFIGHSRGGEAVAVAAALHRSTADLPGTELARGAEVRSVVALAPSDGTDLIDGEPVRLDGPSYLTIGGTHDADVGTFAGAQQYARTRVGEGALKAAVAVYRANHSQFNGRWGSYDAGLGAAKHLLDTAALLDARDQQQATAAFVSAFLDASVSADPAAAELFTGDLPDAAWLPDTDYRITAAAGDQAGVHDVDDDGGRLGTAGAVQVSGGTAEVTGLPRRTGAAGPSVLHVRPERPGAVVTVTVGTRAPEPHDVVVVDLATAAEAGAGQPVGVAVELSDAAGVSATCPLSGEDGVPAQLPARTVKLGFLQRGSVSEPHLQTYRVPVTCAAEAGVDLSAVETLRLRIEGLGATGLYLDNAGVTATPRAGGAGSGT